MQIHLAAAGLAFLIGLVLPGWAISVWLNGRRDLLERLAELVGLSLGLGALGALAAFELHVQVRLPLIWAGLGVCLLLGLWGEWHGRTTRVHLQDVLGVFLLLGLVGLRLAQTRGLVLPPWVDSLHHTLAVQKIMALGGLPLDWRPAADAPFFYHYGFHVAAALVAGLAKIEPAAAVLFTGQLLNAWIALSVYCLGRQLEWSRAQAGLAALLVGLGFEMPAYYLNWGRYTLAAGSVILPLAMGTLRQLLLEERPARRWTLGLQLALLTGGVCLTHYLLVGVLCLWLAAQALQSRLRRRWLPVVLSVGLGGLMASPWLLRGWLLGGRLAQVGWVGADQAMTWLDLWALLGPLRSHALFVLGAGRVGLGADTAPGTRLRGMGAGTDRPGAALGAAHPAF